MMIERQKIEDVLIKLLQAEFGLLESQAIDHAETAGSRIVDQLVETMTHNRSLGRTDPLEGLQ